ncbi:MAG: DNA alkylation repair protein [Gaiella sp.]
MNADDAVAALTTAFSAHLNPTAAAEMSAYMRGLFPFFGIRSPLRRELQRAALSALVKPTADDVLDIADACWARDERELQYAAADLIRRHDRRLGASHLPRLKRLITTKSWWDTVDGLAPAVGAVVRREPIARQSMNEWLEADDIWLIRVAILHQERWKGDTDAGWLFAACVRHAGHPDFFIRKAIGWALRSYAHTAPEAVRDFLRSDGAHLAPLSRREAEKGIARHSA